MSMKKLTTSGQLILCHLQRWEGMKNLMSKGKIVTAEYSGLL